MDTLNQILPVYDSINKQDVRRYNAREIRNCPLGSLLPFQIKRTHIGSNHITSLKLVDSSGVKTEIITKFVTGADLISSWTNDPAGAGAAGYNTFGVVGISPNPCIGIDSTGSDAYSNTFACTLGDIIIFSINLTLNSGQAPSCRLVNASLVVKSNAIALSSGSNTIMLIPTETANLSLQIYNTGNTNFLTSITLHKKMSLHVYQYTSVDYIQYNGEDLSSVNDSNYYYFEATDGTNTWYSDWFYVQDTTGMIYLSFTNSLDLGDILYKHGFAQGVYFNETLLQDEPKEIITGDTKDGVIIIEKRVVSPVFTLIDHISPSMLKVLYLIAGHSGISLIDDVGVTHSPNNLEVTQSHDYYDNFQITIKFTENEIVNTLNVNNIT